MPAVAEEHQSLLAAVLPCLLLPASSCCCLWKMKDVTEQQCQGGPYQEKANFFPDTDDTAFSPSSAR